MSIRGEVMDTYLNELCSMVGRSLDDDTHDECCAAITKMAGRIVGTLPDECSRDLMLHKIAMVAEATREGLEVLGVNF
jgi:hypothetical protein